MRLVVQILLPQPNCRDLGKEVLLPASRGGTTVYECVCHVSVVHPGPAGGATTCLNETWMQNCRQQKKGSLDFAYLQQPGWKPGLWSRSAACQLEICPTPVCGSTAPDHVTVPHDHKTWRSAAGTQLLYFYSSLWLSKTHFFQKLHNLLH